MKNSELVEDQNVVSSDTAGNGKRQEASSASRKQQAKYPKYTLDEALEIPRAIQDKFAGKPMPPKTLAQACGASYGNSRWRVKLAASAQYGLTKGSYSGTSVSLTPRAESILKPKTPEERNRAMREAAREPVAMRAVYDHFDNGVIPGDQFFLNTLERDFNIPADQCEPFLAVLKANAGYAYWRSARGDEEQPAVMPSEDERTSGSDELARQGEAVARAASGPESAPIVFLPHGENNGILDVLRTTMDVAGFGYEVAEDEETTALPVPTKIMESMRRCSAAIINVSADGREKRADGSFGINQNVLIEIGCAFALYGQQRCILLWDTSVEVPSNLQGLYRCEYSGDSLSAAYLLRLQKAIAKFRDSGSPPQA